MSSLSISEAMSSSSSSKALYQGEVNRKRQQTDSVSSTALRQFSSSTHHRKRKRLSFTTNRTAARMQVTEQGEAPSLKLEDLKDTINDHAYRRVQLFYYLCVAYFKEGRIVSRGKTDLQHGKGRHPGFCAAHSSILPHVVDTGKGDSLFHSGSKFYQTLNSTVELPTVVNDYDCVIEDTMRPEALSLLNQVSLENLHPYTATKIFVSKMEAFLLNSKKELNVKLNLLVKLQSVENELSFMEDALRKSGSPVRIQWLECYILKVLELGKVRKDIRQQSDYSRKVSLKGRIFPVHQVYNIVNGNRPNFYNPSTESITISSSLQSYLYGRVIEDIFSRDSWNPLPITPQYSRLSDLLAVNSMQFLATALPSYEKLSGRFIDGRLTGFDDDQLAQQKQEIIDD